MPKTNRSDLIIPTVHLNGTSEVGLIEPLMKARNAVIDAARALNAAAPHARDYYVQGDWVYNLAKGQHVQRYVILHNMIDELGWIIQGIQDQQREK